MPRKATRSVKDDENNGAVAFLDALPANGADPKLKDEEEDDTDEEEDEEDEDGEDEDEDEEDDGSDDSGEGLPIAATVSVPRAPRPQVAQVAPVAQRAPRAPRAPREPRQRDEFDDPMLIDTPRMPRTPGIRGPRNMSAEQRASSPALNRAREYQENAYSEVDEMLGTLNFAQRKYEVRVTRLEPDTDENGVTCTGLLHTYKQRVSLEQIQQRFGGGTYEINIWGPHPQSGKPAYIKKETIAIAGHPKPMPSFVGKNRDEESTSATADVVRAFAESNERSQKRFAEVMERASSAPSALVEIMPMLQPIVEKLFAKSDETARALIEAQRADKSREEERRQAEREVAREEREREREAKAEDRRQEEKREERKREEERERRKDDIRAEEKKEADRREREKEEREAAREQRELERERAKEDAARMREEMKEGAAEKQRQHERDLAAQQERWKQEQQRATEHAAMMQNFMQMNMDAMERKQENGGLESVTKQLLMLKDLNSTLTGDDREPSTMEKFQEGLQSMVTTLLPVGQQLKNAMGTPTTTKTTAVVQQQRAVVVDLGPHRAALPATAPVANTTPASNPAPTDATAAAAQHEDIVNDLKQITIPKEADSDAMTQAQILMKNVDLAVQRNMTAEQIVEQILNPFEDACPFIMNMASGLTEEQLLEMVVNNVVDTNGNALNWAILSPRGEELIVKAFKLWRDQDDGDDARAQDGE